MLLQPSSDDSSDELFSCSHIISLISYKNHEKLINLVLCCLNNRRYNINT